MERFDVFIIGGGGTGSEITGRLGRAGGLKVGLAERDKLGGECNWYGCVPSKIMLHSARVASTARKAARYGVNISSVSVDPSKVIERVTRIVEGNTSQGAKPYEDMGVRVILDEVRVVGPNRLEIADGTQIEAGKIVLATGTEPTAPPIEGLDRVPYWTNREAIWELKELPAAMAILGSGPIGIEFAQIYARFGARVTLIEVDDRILPPEDADSAAALRPALEEDGIEILVGAKTTKVTHGSEGFRLKIEGRDDIVVERLLVATGRKPCFDGQDLDAVGVRLDERGMPVLSRTLRSTNPDIWIAGDATGDLLFVHVNDYEAEIVADDIRGNPRARDYRVVPKVTYCEPEVASVGLTEQAARDDGHEVVTSIMRFDDNERANIEDARHGIVKLVADTDGELLGGHIVGENAGEMIHEVVAAMAARVPARTLGDAIHAYPTLSQSVRGAFFQLAERLGA